MKLPTLTHLHFIILARLGKEQKTGICLREEIKIEKSLAAFYQLMSRMERDGLVEQDYLVTPREEDGQIVRQAIYKATLKGKREVEKSIQFYSQYASQ